MTGNVRQTPPELTWGTLWVTCDNSPTFDGTGPQNAPEGTVDMNSIDNLREYVLTAPSICSTTRAILVGYVDEIESEVKANRAVAYDKGYDEGFASADDWIAQHEDAMAEHGWVRKSKEHVVSHATVEVAPHIDWSHMADELDVFTQLVRGFAEQVEEDA